MARNSQRAWDDVTCDPAWPQCSGGTGAARGTGVDPQMRQLVIVLRGPPWFYLRVFSTQASVFNLISYWQLKLLSWKWLAIDFFPYVSLKIGISLCHLLSNLCCFLLQRLLFLHGLPTERSLVVG